METPSPAKKWQICVSSERSTGTVENRWRSVGLVECPRIARISRAGTVPAACAGGSTAGDGDAKRAAAGFCAGGGAAPGAARGCTSGDGGGAIPCNQPDSRESITARCSSESCGSHDSHHCSFTGETRSWSQSSSNVFPLSFYTTTQYTHHSTIIQRMFQ